MFRRTLLAALTALAFAVPAMAGQIVPFDANSFAAAQTADQPIVIHVTAPWCPTCQAQHPVISGLAADPENPDLVVFNVDFDTAKDVLRLFNVRQQSTLIAFRGSSERVRAVGITDPAAIAALVAKTR
jgi:thiol-disulfide isomerase/thioredoxin